MTAAANWYADPYDASRLRWWDGAQWTEHTHDAAPPQVPVQRGEVPSYGTAPSYGSAPSYASAPSYTTGDPASAHQTLTPVAAAPYPQARTGPATAGAHACQFCGAVPARPTEFTAVRGYVLLSRFGPVRRQVCRDCGTALFRQVQDSTLTLGWWSVISYVVTVIAVVRNVVELGKVGALGTPTGQQSRPVDAGKPLSQRPGPYIAAVAVVVVPMLAYRWIF